MWDCDVGVTLTAGTPPSLRVSAVAAGKGTVTPEWVLDN